MTAWAGLEAALRAVHRDHPALRDFVAFPDDLEPRPVAPRHMPCADLAYADPVFQMAEHPLARAFLEAGPVAWWRDTYVDTDIGADFMARFGCYCAIGGGGAWTSRKMAGYVVTMPAGLDYTWHHHPAEEMYLVLAGEAEFYREGEVAEVLRAGDTSFHASMQPHAMATKDSPVMCYVTWRNHLDTPPVLTEREVARA